MAATLAAIRGLPSLRIMDHVATSSPVASRVSRSPSPMPPSTSTILFHRRRLFELHLRGSRSVAWYRYRGKNDPQASGWLEEEYLLGLGGSADFIPRPDTRSARALLMRPREILVGHCFWLRVRSYLGPALRAHFTRRALVKWREIAVSEGGNELKDPPAREIMNVRLEL